MLNTQSLPSGIVSNYVLQNNSSLDNLLDIKIVKNHIKRVNEIKNQIDDNLPKIRQLEAKLDDDIRKIEREKSKNKTPKELNDLENKKITIFVEYLKQKALLNYVGNDIVFFDKSRGYFLKISKETKTIDDKEVEYRLTETLNKETIGRLFDDEAKTKLNKVLPQKELNYLIKWLNNYKKIFNPKKPKLKNGYFNTYEPCGFLEVEVENTYDLDFFIDVVMSERYPHIKALYENIAPIRDELKYKLNWFSSILNTGLKLRNCPTHIGAEGTGKGVEQTLLIEFAFMTENCYTITNDDLNTNFNSFLEDKLFLYFNETKGNFEKSSTQADKVKPIITDNTLSINPKNEKQYKIDNFANCQMSSNHQEPIAIGSNDRRYSIIETSNKKLVDIAREKFNLSIDDYINKIIEEREAFLIELKCIKYDLKLAKSLIENDKKDRIKEATNTQKDLLKDKILNQDVEWFRDKLDDLMELKGNSVMIEREEKRVIYNDVGDKKIHCEPIPFKESNSELMNMFLKEVEQGVFTNYSLRWFSEFYELDNLKGDKKFGEFWNTVINKGTHLNVKNSDFKTIRLRILKTKETPREIFIKEVEYQFNETYSTIVKIEDIF